MGDAAAAAAAVKMVPTDSSQSRLVEPIQSFDLRPGDIIYHFRPEKDFKIYQGTGVLCPCKHRKVFLN